MGAYGTLYGGTYSENPNKSDGFGVEHRFASLASASYSPSSSALFGDVALMETVATDVGVSYTGPNSRDLALAQSLVTALGAAYTAAIQSCDVQLAQSIAVVLGREFTAYVPASYVPRNARVGLSYVSGPWQLPRRIIEVLRDVRAIVARATDPTVVARLRQAAAVAESLASSLLSRRRSDRASATRRDDVVVSTAASEPTLQEE